MMAAFQRLHYHDHERDLPEGVAQLARHRRAQLALAVVLNQQPKVAVAVEESGSGIAQRPASEARRIILATELVRPPPGAPVCGR